MCLPKILSPPTSQAGAINPAMAHPTIKKQISALQLEKIINSRLYGTGIIVSVSSDPDKGWTAEPIIAPRTATHPRLDVERVVAELRTVYSLK